jgi:hypothetical protein
VPVVPATEHLSARDHINPSDLLFENGSLCGSQLRISEIALDQLSKRDKPIKRRVPTRHAIGADHGGGKGRILWHRFTSLAEETGSQAAPSVRERQLKPLNESHHCPEKITPTSGVGSGIRRRRPSQHLLISWQT